MAESSPVPLGRASIEEKASEGMWEGRLFPWQQKGWSTRDGRGMTRRGAVQGLCEGGDEGMAGWQATHGDFVY
jgi:hypothetical protein